MSKREFVKAVVHTPEVKRGTAHFIVSVAVGLLSILLSRRK